MHFFRGAFEETATPLLGLVGAAGLRDNISELTPNEQRISRENHPVLAIFHQKAYAILGMTRSVQGFHRDILSNLESFPVLRRASHCLALLPGDDRKVTKLRELALDE